MKKSYRVALVLLIGFLLCSTGFALRFPGGKQDADIDTKQNLIAQSVKPAEKKWGDMTEQERYNHMMRGTVISYDGWAEPMFEDHADLENYLPFGPMKEQRRLREKITLVISSDYPRIDGATSAYPLYAAAAEATYQGLDGQSVQEFVRRSRTKDAYNNLIYHNMEIFFGPLASPDLDLLPYNIRAENIYSPVAKDAFVFLVHKDNPVDNLTIEQIQDIYQKKIVSWKAVGGNDEKILPFQREDGSGSQCVMLAEVMRDKAIAPPLVMEHLGAMMMVFTNVADYLNYPSSIGYSFHYYATKMVGNPNIKLLSVNDVAPTEENIRNGTYPLVVNIYAVTTTRSSKNANRLVKWLQSEQGQRLVEKCGYIGL